MLSSPIPTKRHVNTSDNKTEIFYADDGQAYVVDSAPESVLKQEADKQNHIISEVRLVKNLQTGEMAVLKMERLPSSSQMQKFAKEFIDNEVVCGKRAGQLLGSRYIGDKHYQLLKYQTGLPLICGFSALETKRFNPFVIKEDEKIEILQEIIRELKKLHFDHKIIHRDLYGDNILISKNEGHYKVNIIDYGIAAPLCDNHHGLVYRGISGDSVYSAKQKLRDGIMPGQATDRTQTLDEDNFVHQTIIEGLNIQNPVILSKLQTFFEKIVFSPEQYDNLIDELEMLKHSSNLSFNLFDTQVLPQATKGKNIICLIIHNYVDGIGDFMHGWDFAKQIKQALAEKGYELHALVKIHKSEQEEESGLNQRAKFVEQMLMSPDSPFDHHLAYTRFTEQEGGFKKWCEEHAKELAHLSDNTVGAIEVSYPSELPEVFPKDLKIIKCFQYGYQSSGSKKTPTFNNAPLGVNNDKRKNNYGVVMHHNPIPENTKADRLISIAKNNKKFIEQLLNTDVLNKKNATAYLKTHRLMPAYLQTVSAACAFVLTQALRYKNDEKVCDFLLPRNVIDEKTVKALLIKAGFGDNEIAFIYPDTPINASPHARIRVFCSRIVDNDDYQALYNLTDDGAGCSGDSSFSTVISSDHLPYYEYKGGPIGKLYEPQLLNFVKSCIKEAKLLNDRNLEQGLENLANYFYHLNRFRALGKNVENPQSSPGEDVLPHEPEQFSLEHEIAEIMSEAFYQYCVTTSQFQQKEHIKRAWRYVQTKLKQNNTHDHLLSIIKGSIFLTEKSNREVNEILKQSNEIKGLLLDGVVKESEINNLPYQVVMLLADTRIAQLIKNQYLTVRMVDAIFGEQAMCHVGWKIKKGIKELHKNLTGIYDPDEKKILQQSPGVIFALATEIITFDQFRQNLAYFKLESDHLEVLMHIGNFKEALAMACRTENNTSIVTQLLNEFYAHSPRCDTKMIDEVLSGYYREEYKDLLLRARECKEKLQNRIAYLNSYDCKRLSRKSDTISSEVQPKIKQLICSK
ncbi:protein kinase domain-containing protein [Candidatus Berkiella aquae]|uniref:Protein kinase domain protein n=1 Tax=Candidatus Berkiella aquae TaxID=295108 RepID=A0A0Q9YSU9_9GAMM|nr:hypothetical protein [Candidatus Berkiella aquae]MCS5712185.1 hypothetical protein [Candidatus Berkiella aquae]